MSFDGKKLTTGILIGGVIVSTLIIHSLTTNRSSGDTPLPPTVLSEELPTEKIPDSNNVSDHTTHKKFYIRGVANVRKCTSMSCEVVGQYPTNTEITLAYRSVSEMPEWIEISWFDKNGREAKGYINKILFSPVVVTINPKTDFTTFYLKSEQAYLYDCPRTSCKPVLQYRRNDAIQFQKDVYSSIDELPDWVQIKWSLDGKDGLGYLEKSHLSEFPSRIENQLPQPRPSSLGDVFQDWSYAVPIIFCVDVGWGSGTLFRDSRGEYVILTNKHVVEGAEHCVAGFSPEPSSGKGFGVLAYFEVYVTSGITMSQSDDEVILGLRPMSQGFRNVIQNTQSDQGFREANFPDSLAMIPYFIKNNNICSVASIKIGDEVAILGYPAAGSRLGITVTKGIIAGVEGDYYVTDAKIERGNSGGAAILIRDNCYIGIPTFALVGDIESIARIFNVAKFTGNIR